MNRPLKSISTPLIVLCLTTLMVACATTAARTPVPPILTSKAEISNLQTARIWGDASRAEITNFFDEKFKQTPKLKITETTKSGRPVFSILALSGGGDNGAFGAGILNGWTASGARPEFSIVTGVSTGALSAPFAFLGPKYDHNLEEIYTKYSTNDLLIFEPVKGLFGGIAVADSSPLAKILAKFINSEFLDQIAAEYASGRYLLIATTNIDAQRQVIWNMGAIAASNDKNRVELFRNVLLASAAVPGVFPPVKINVTANGKVFDELHVDGGLTRQVFLGPPNLSIRSFDKQYRKKPIYNAYIIRNGHTNPEYKVTKQKTLAIAGRSISTLIKSQSIGDLYRIYAVCKRDKIGFNLVSIPNDVENTSKEAFDIKYMKKLYARGFELAASKPKWRKSPD